MPGQPSRLIPVMTLFLALLCPAQAQSDPQTDDWSRQDRRYLDRMKKQAEQDKAGKRSPEEFREAFIEEAKSLIRDKNYSAKKTAHYLVRTDDPRVDPEAAAVLLEQFREHFIAYWKDEVELNDYRPVSPVFLFYSYYKYNKILTGKARFDAFRPAGHYRSDLDLITLHSDASPLSELPAALVHEASHQLVENMLFPPGSGQPDWIDEGLANYFGYHGLDAMGKRSATIGRDGKKAAPRGGRALHGELKQALGDRDNPFSVIDLLDMESAREFYGPAIRVHYAASWALVHYLLEGEGGRYREPFLNLLSEDPTLAGGAERLVAALGVDTEEFKSGYERHARKMKP